MPKFPSISQNVWWYASRPTSSMSVDRKTFWTVTMRLAGGCFCPRKNGTSGCMPALVKRTLGSSFSTRGALGRRTWPLSSKNLMNFSRISELSSAPAPYDAYEKTRGRPHGHSPRPPCPSEEKSNESGSRARAALVAAGTADVLPLTLRLVGELASLDLRLRREVLRDLLQLVRAALELFAARAQLLAREIPRLRRIQQRHDGSGE